MFGMATCVICGRRTEGVYQCPVRIEFGYTYRRIQICEGCFDRMVSVLDDSERGRVRGAL